MEKDVALGNVGKLSVVFSGGKATVSVSAAEAVPGGSASVNVSASAVVDANVLADLIFGAIEKASPAGVAPLEEGVKLIVKNAIASIQ